MIISIDKFRSQTDKTIHDAKELELTMYDIFSTVKNMSVYWNDSYTQSFFQVINKEVKIVDELFNSFDKFLDVMKTITSRYTSLRDGAISQIGYTDIINSFNYVPNEADESTIAKLKSSITLTINTIEDDVADMLSKIEPFENANISFDNLDFNSEKSDFVGMADNMPEEIKKMEIKLELLRRKSDLLLEGLYSLALLYSSHNSSIIVEKIEDIKVSIEILSSDLFRALEYIRSRQDSYKQLFANLASSIRGIKYDK